MASDTCEQFLADTISSILGDGEKQSVIDPYVKAMMMYSGQYSNDQGDLQACLRTPSMNFVEAQFFMNGFILFRGLCLKDVCNSEYLTEHKSDISTLLTQLFKTPIPAETMSFYQFPYTKPSQDNSGFIIITLILSIIFLMVLLSFAFLVSKKVKLINLSKKSNHTTESKSENLKDSLISRNVILNDQKPSIALLIDSKQNENQSEPQNERVKNSKYKDLIFKIIDCWDVKNNVKKSFTMTVRNTDLLAFDCIRVLSFLQVVLGHQFLINCSYFQNLQDFAILQKHPFILFVLSCFYSVDAFFLLGGFFVAYVTADSKILQHFQIKNIARMICSFFTAILNRVSRILPSYFIQLYIMWQYLNLVGDSPTQQKLLAFSGYCSENKWKKFLFIDNLLNQEIRCFTWSWYLPNDLQMFIGSLILMIVYANHKKIGKIAIVFALSAFTGVAIYYAFEYKLLIASSISTMSNPNWSNFYQKPWTRSPPYILGLLFGVLYKEYSLEKKNIQKESFLSKISHQMSNTSWKWISYIFGLSIILFLIFGPRPLQLNGEDYWNSELQYFIYGISRVSYTFGIVLILLPGVCGSRDLLVRVMSAKIFQFVSKLTFQGYLFHFTFLQFVLWGSKDAMYLNIENLIFIFIAEVIIILFFSYFFLILIEMPINNLANIIFNKSAAKSDKKQQNLPLPQSSEKPLNNSLYSKIN